MSVAQGDDAQQAEAAHIMALIDRAAAGDQQVLDDLQHLMDHSPHLFDAIADAAKIAETDLVLLAVGDNLIAQEAYKRELARRRQELLADARTPEEALLVERIVLCWLDMTACQSAAARSLRQRAENAPANMALQRRLDQSQGRFLSAIKCLATLKKLLRPTRVHVAIQKADEPDHSYLGNRFALNSANELVGAGT